MTMRQRSRRLLAVLAVALLPLTACTQVDPGATDNDAGGTDTPAETDTLKTGQGVTEEACPDAINPDNGCIYLGVLSDLTEGPFAALAVPITDAQRDFWRLVNERGGLSGYDIDIDANTRDTKYVAAEHAAQYNQIAGEVVALAQTLGTVNTESVLDDMTSRSLVAVPTTWWSGFAFEENDGGIVLETGYSYCTEAIVGLDWFSENHGAPTKVQAVGYPGDYGGDSAEGVRRWAEINEVELADYVPTAPNQVAGNQDAVVSAVAAASPDVVVLGIGPAETAEIVGKLAATGFTGRFMGALPTWNPALLDSPAAGAITAMYNHMSPYENWDGESQGIQDMKEALNGSLPTNGGYVIGWAIGYPMLAVLEAAIDNGDITPEGLASVVDGLTASYNGMSPDQTYGGDPQMNAVQSVYIGQPNSEVELGMETIERAWTGTTFDQTDYSSACVASQ